MLDFIINYPTKHYIKQLFLGRPGRKVGVYTSPHTTFLAIKSKDGVEYFTGNIGEMDGAPTLSILEDKEYLRTTTLFHKEILNGKQVNRLNHFTLIVDDYYCFNTTHNVGIHETAQDLYETLVSNPNLIINSWKNFNAEETYNWEIFSTKLEVLRGKKKLPKRVFLCGFPEEKIINAWKWADENNLQLINFVPAAMAVLRWVLERSYQKNVFLLISLATEIVISYIQDGEIKLYSEQKTKDGFTSEDISDFNDLVEEIGGAGRNSEIWTYGIIPSGTAYEKLHSRYRNLKLLTVETLKEHKEIETRSEQCPSDKEIWIIENEL